eukprot:TRINITY_DN1947_c0_g1_i1.p1 TRINITY_DN1947_c0_g1~~TRINITY_DN1947_c0_g1_i1.p1  ORF type:complete len:567 (-),score=161.96 TRINITY_DN1947_c0_g1_i1:53-1753(-)
MITAIEWVGREKINFLPEKQELGKEIDGDEEEQAEVKEKKVHSKHPNDDTDSDLDEFGFSDGDDEDEFDDDDVIPKGRLKGDSKIADMMYYADPSEDPFLKENEDGNDSELEDDVVRPSDTVIVTSFANNGDEDFSYIGVHIYEESENNLFMHHDIVLPTFPLTVAWMDYPFSGKEDRENHIAVGTFDPGIEIWNLDNLNPIEPQLILGGPEEVEDSLKKPKKIKGAAKQKLKSESHTSGVMSLAWNRSAKNLLLSGSIDTTVKLWDLSKVACVQTFRHHKGEVQSVQWSPVDQNIFLSGSFDKTVLLNDIRVNPSVPLSKWSITADCESIQWDPRNPTNFVVGTEDGNVKYFDGKAGGKKSLWTLGAHSNAVSSLAINPSVPGLLVTGSADKHLKFWDFSAGLPKLIVGLPASEKIFGVSFFSESPFLLAIGGDRGVLRVIDIRDVQKVNEKYGDGNRVSNPNMLQFDEESEDEKEDFLDLGAMDINGRAPEGDEEDEFDEEEEDEDVEMDKPISKNNNKPKNKPKNNNNNNNNNNNSSSSKPKKDKDKNKKKEKNKGKGKKNKK